LIENTVYFTEAFDTTGSAFISDSNAIVTKKNCATGTPNCAVGGGNSFLHSKLDYYCATGYNPVGPESCLMLEGGAYVQFENLNINFNINGPDPNTAVVRVDSASEFLQNAGTLVGENDTSGGGGYTFGGTGYYEWEGLSGFCAGCKDTFATSTALAQSGMDAMLTAGPAPLGGFLGNTYINQIAQVTQAIAGWELTCINVTGGACTTAPTINMTEGGNVYGSVVCPTTVATSRSTAFSNIWYPNQPLFMILSAPGSGCTAPYFTVQFHYRIR
jgi:hypothetical protein